MLDGLKGRLIAVRDATYKRLRWDRESLARTAAVLGDRRLERVVTVGLTGLLLASLGYVALELGLRPPWQWVVGTLTGVGTVLGIYCFVVMFRAARPGP